MMRHSEQTPQVCKCLPQETGDDRRQHDVADSVLWVR